MSEYTGPIVDSHQHFWQFDENRYTYFGADDSLFGTDAPASALRRDFMPDDYEAASVGLNIVATVHIEAGWSALRDPIEETVWVESLDKRPGLAAAIVGGAAFHSADGAEQVARQSAQRKMAGIRQNLRGAGAPADASQLAGAAWADSVAALQEHHLMLELFMDLPHIPEVAALAERHPDLPIVVDHAVSLGQRTPEGLELWRAGIRSLASRGNVRIKASGIRTGLAGAGQDPSDAAVSRVVDELLEAFGVDRVMFASDYPLTELAGGLSTVYGQFLRIAEAMAPDEQRMLFEGNASQVYGIGQPIVT